MKTWERIYRFFCFVFSPSPQKKSRRIQLGLNYQNNTINLSGSMILELDCSKDFCSKRKIVLDGLTLEQWVNDKLADIIRKEWHLILHSYRLRKNKDIAVTLRICLEPEIKKIDARLVRLSVI